MRWPAAIPKVVRYGASVSHFDVFDTAAAAAGAIPIDKTMKAPLMPADACVYCGNQASDSCRTIDPIL